MSFAAYAYCFFLNLLYIYFLHNPDQFCSSCCSLGEHKQYTLQDISSLVSAATTAATVRKDQPIRPKKSYLISLILQLFSMYILNLNVFSWTCYTIDYRNIHVSPCSFIFFRAYRLILLKDYSDFTETCEYCFRYKDTVSHFPDYDDNNCNRIHVFALRFSWIRSPIYVTSI
jgi:hypothetical protein